MKPRTESEINAMFEMQREGKPCREIAESMGRSLQSVYTKMSELRKTGGKYTLSKYTEQLCWSCRRATNPPGLGCSWVRRFVPVPGWEAEPVTMVSKCETWKDIETYHITGCPQFLEDRA